MFRQEKGAPNICNLYTVMEMIAEDTHIFFSTGEELTVISSLPYFSVWKYVPVGVIWTHTDSPDFLHNPSPMSPGFNPRP